MMKKYPFFITFVVLLFCSSVSTSFFWRHECSAVIAIYNKLPSDIKVTIEGASKQLDPWGSCTELAEDGTSQIVPCYNVWDVGWDKSVSPLSLFLNLCESLTDEDEEDYGYEHDHDYQEEEDVEKCKDYTVDLTFKGVNGLDRSLTLSDKEQEILVINEYGLWKVKSPYLDYPEHFRDVYKWLGDAELDQP